MYYRNRKNVDYKKITVEILYTTFLNMDYYCSSSLYPGKKGISYARLIDNAINEYIENHT